MTDDKGAGDGVAIHAQYALIHDNSHDWDIRGDNSEWGTTCKVCGFEFRDFHVRVMQLKSRIEKLEEKINTSQSIISKAKEIEESAK